MVSKSYNEFGKAIGPGPSVNRVGRGIIQQIDTEDLSNS